ncbi:MAG: DUF6249 domain-containing protein [Bacteroidia bacterium]
MVDELAVMIPIAFFFFVYLIVRTISDNRLKRIVVEQQADVTNLQHLFRRPPASLISSLKWGMLLIGIGAGVMVGKQFDGPDPEMFIISSMVLGAGIALVLFYILGHFIEKNQNRQNREESLEPQERDRRS